MVTERIGGWGYRREQALRLLLIAGGVLALLDANGLVARATQMSLGPLRDTCLATATGLQAATHAVGLDRPVSALHRSFMQQVEPAEAEPAEPEAPVTAETPVSAGTTSGHPAAQTTPGAGTTASQPAGPRPTPAYSASRPLRALLIGDSMMGDLEVFLRPAINRNPAMRAKVDSRVSTGLTRPDFFDWPAHMRKVLANEQFDVIVVMMGPNDYQDVIVNGERYFANKPEWADLYTQRATKFVALLASHAVRVYWVGLPRMRSAVYDKKMRVLDTAYRKACATQPNAVYLSAASVLSDANGNYTSYLTVDGERTQIRRGDGCHCTMAGAKLEAEMVFKRIMADAFPNGQSKPKTPTS